MKLFLAFLLPFPCFAEDFATRAQDQRLGQAELHQKLAGHTIEFHDGGTSAFYSGGRYEYTYGGGGLWHGQYEIGTDSMVCVTFVTGTKRCDRYVISGDRLMLITEDGTRFPIKSIR